MIGTAVLSEDGRYRYELTREWPDQGEATPFATFCMLNPSMAAGLDDAGQLINDPTMTRCVGFAKSWGYTGLRIVNLYGLVATHPNKLWAKTPAFRIGRDNDHYLRHAARQIETEGGIIVAGWGRGPSMLVLGAEHQRRVAEVAAIFGGEMWCLGTNANGSPKHPLYLAAETPLERWNP